MSDEFSASPEIFKKDDKGIRRPAIGREQLISKIDAEIAEKGHLCMEID